MESGQDKSRERRKGARRARHSMTGSLMCSTTTHCRITSPNQAEFTSGTSASANCDPLTTECQLKIPLQEEINSCKCVTRTEVVDRELGLGVLRLVEDLSKLHDAVCGQRDAILPECRESIGRDRDQRAPIFASLPTLPYSRADCQHDIDADHSPRSPRSDISLPSPAQVLSSQKYPSAIPNHVRLSAIPSVVEPVNPDPDHI